jgi:hypothetical protein
MGVVWVWNLKTSGGKGMSVAVADWRKASRGKVDAVISKVWWEHEEGIMKKGTSCPECSYIIRSTSFPAFCIYCGSAL